MTTDPTDNALLTVHPIDGSFLSSFSFEQSTPNKYGGMDHEVQLFQGYDGPEATAAATAGGEVTTVTPELTGRFPIIMYLSCDFQKLNTYQCLMRHHIEFFEAVTGDVNTKIQGRNKPIVLGQVGIRWIHCNTVSPDQKCRGAVYYPQSLIGIYQAAQILCTTHLIGTTGNDESDSGTRSGSGSISVGCPYVPQLIRQELQTLKCQRNIAASGSSSPINISGTGKGHWAETAAALGLYEDEHGFRFQPRIGNFICPRTTGP
jgi:hypothetical protein